jgi:AcrR family transcriptional regulator
MPVAKERTGPTGQRGSGARRLSAEERRDEVLRAATAEFALGGYAGTSTESIAARAGISQPYLFRLFGTKRDLFIATMAEMHARIERAFRSAAAGLQGLEAMGAMGEAYHELLSERDLLLVQLHAFAAAGSDPVIGRASREGMRRLWVVTEELTGLPDEAIRTFFAQGMLLNVLAAIDAPSIDEWWVRACQSKDDTYLTYLASLPTTS